MPEFLVYSPSLPDGAGSYRITHWANANNRYEVFKTFTNDVVVENTWNFTPRVSDGSNDVTYNWFNPSTEVFTRTTVSNNISTASAEDAYHYLAQSAAGSTTANRLLRYFETSGAFGLGSTVPDQITDFTAETPPAGFYYMDEANIIGGPSVTGLTRINAVKVCRTSGNGVAFYVSRISATNFRSWVGTRAANTGAVTWIEVLNSSSTLSVANLTGTKAQFNTAVTDGDFRYVGDTQTASTISDFDTAVAANSAVAANTAKSTNATHTGDVTGATALTIAARAVTWAKVQAMATARLLGRSTAGSGDVEELTAAQGRTLLSLPAITVSTTAPGSPSVGDLWVDTN
jgi:hypothetical protein